MKVAVLGAGIAGLTVAWELVRRGLDVTVIEASDRPGGMIRSERASGYLLEHGPNSIQPNADFHELTEELELSSDIVQANPSQRNRFVVRGGDLVPIPLNPREMLRTKLFTARGKLRLLAEPFIPRGTGEESVAEFVRRRVGQEFLDYAINPFVAGVYAGDPVQLSLRHAFPRMADLEQRHGSLIRGMIARKRNAGGNSSAVGSKPLVSFAGGMETLTLRMSARLGERVRLSRKVRKLTRERGGWVIQTDPGQVSDDIFGAVVSTIPLHQLADLGIPGLERFEGLVHPPITVVGLGYQRNHVQHHLEGFGFLVPSVEREFKILGALFSSSLFPGRAPDGHTLITVFLGGMRHRDDPNLKGRAAVETARRDVERLLHVTAPPAFERVVYRSRGIPQYGLRHADILARLEHAERRYPGLFFAGNFRGGISVVDTVTNARSLSHQVARLATERG